MTPILELERKFLDDIKALEEKHIEFHLGDETLMERHARVEGNKLIIGEQTYTTVVLPEYICFMENTQKLLDEFNKAPSVEAFAKLADEHGDGSVEGTVPDPMADDTGLWLCAS